MVPTWSLQLAVRNAIVLPHPRTHECDIAVRARIVWRERGEQWVDAVATGWCGTAVRVHLMGDPEGVVWIEARDIRRR